MASTIPVFPEFPDFLLAAIVEGVEVVFRFTYRERTGGAGAWWLDLHQPSETPGELGPAILRGRRISPRFLPLFGFVPVGWPQDQVIGIDGPLRGDPYAQASLGEDVVVYLFGSGEISPAEETAGGLTITFPSP